MVNSYYQFLGRRFTKDATILQYINQREDMLTMLQKGFDIQRDQAKRLLISLGFGGSFANWASRELGEIPEEKDGSDKGETCSWVLRFEAALRPVLQKCKEKLGPEARKWHANEKNASFAFSVYADAERYLLDAC